MKPPVKPPVEAQTLSVGQAQDALADLEERIIRGEKLDPLVLVAAEARVRLAAKETEVADRARRRAKQEALEAAAAEGEAWFANEAPPLVGVVLEAMAGAVEATRALVLAVGEYQRGADVAAGQIGRLRHRPSQWPAGRGVLDKVFDELKASAMGHAPSSMWTPISEQLRRAATPGETEG